MLDTNQPSAAGTTFRATASPATAAAPAESHASAVSFGAVFAGAAGAAALSLILLVLGTGLGMSTVSPWAGQGASAGVLGFSTILWLTFTQIAASGMGGYLAGRLRTRWAGLHGDEVYFRDTAHGFLAWAVATLVTAATLTSAVSSIVGGGAQAAAAALPAAGKAASGAVAAGGGSAMDGMGYAVDSLFRRDISATLSAQSNGQAGAGATTASSAAGGDTSTAGAQPPTARAAAPSASDDGAGALAEVGRIFANGLRVGSLFPDDARYVGQLIAQRTGMSQADAEKRANDVYTRLQTRLRDAEVTARDAADKARKATAYAALWLFVSLLAGAFMASLCATYGGRRRDA